MLDVPFWRSHFLSTKANEKCACDHWALRGAMGNVEVYRTRRVAKTGIHAWQCVVAVPELESTVGAVFRPEIAFAAKPCSRAVFWLAVREQGWCKVVRL